MHQLASLDVSQRLYQTTALLFTQAKLICGLEFALKLQNFLLAVHDHLSISCQILQRPSREYPSQVESDARLLLGLSSCAKQWSLELAGSLSSHLE